MSDENSTEVRYGRWMVIGKAGKKEKGRRKFVLCRCDCGTVKEVDEASLRYGGTMSCGCFRREVSASIGRAHGTHRMSNTALYHVWEGMLERCENPKAHNYPRYGGRGIRVCEQWHSFQAFMQDVGPRPSAKHSLDRFPDKNGNYELGNVRWATAKEQQRNIRSNRILAFGGESLCVSEWAERLGIRKDMLFKRLAMGWSTEKVLTTAVNTNYQRQRS